MLWNELNTLLLFENSSEDIFFDSRMTEILFDIWVSHDGEDVDFGLLGCSTVTVPEDGGSILRRNVGTYLLVRVTIRKTNVDNNVFYCYAKALLDPVFWLI
jgi:hypothetical protein